MATPPAEQPSLEKHAQEGSDEKESAGSEHPPVVHGDAKVLEVQNEDLALALATGPQLKATSTRSLQLFAILLVAFMGSLSNGFDGQGKPQVHHSPSLGNI
jgi:hypothetical protein